MKTNEAFEALKAKEVELATKLIEEALAAASETDRFNLIKQYECLSDARSRDGGTGSPSLTNVTFISLKSVTPICSALMTSVPRCGEKVDLHPENGIGRTWIVSEVLYVVTEKSSKHTCDQAVAYVRAND